MSRRRMSWADPAALSDDSLSLMEFGTTGAERPMPGCHEHCCSGRAPAELVVDVARLLWQIGGLDLVPLAAWVAAWALALSVAARAGGW